jgi:hypothetical protein
MKKLLETLKQKWAEYLLEIIVIMIGILGAYTLNNWNEDRKTHKKEINLITELKHNLETNITNLERDVKTQIRGAGTIDFLVDHLKNKRPYVDSLSQLFSQAEFAPDVVLASSAYETLKSLGLEIISSDTLRQEVINLFEISYPYLMQETKRLEDLVWPTVVVPMYQKHFEHPEGRGAIPNNYDQLLKDQEFINMLTRRGAMRKNSTKQKNRAIQQTLLVIELLVKELGQNR